MQHDAADKETFNKIQTSYTLEGTVLVNVDYIKYLGVTITNHRANGPVNAHLISWHSTAQNTQNLENIR